MTDQHAPGLLRHNFIVNLLDGGFFGFAMGFASFITIIPLFVSTFTDSAILIGLIPAIHNFGWQIPQLFTARGVGRLHLYRPTVLKLTIQERLPYIGLALLAWISPRLDKNIVLVIIFTLLIWQSLGGGITATAWQSMIGKIMPSDRRGTFFGTQAAAANLLASISAVLAGFILDRLPSPLDFALCFLLASVNMILSWYFLSLTRESTYTPEEISQPDGSFSLKLLTILRHDTRFRSFLIIRMVSQFGVMAFAFYSVYLLRHFQAGALELGLMTSIFLASQIIANPLMGWLGDRKGHARAMQIGLVAATISTILANRAFNSAWFYLVFVFAGIANVAVWTNAMAMTLEFGTLPERPAYIGLSNTIIAPATFLAPLLGGWLANASGYPGTFIFSTVASLFAVFFLYRFQLAPRSLPDPTT